MQYSQIVLKKVFTSEVSSKNAYLKACKWLAKNVVGKNNEMIDYSFKIEKQKGKHSSFLLTLFVNVQEQEVFDHHCDVCRESHRLFYVNEESNCSSCSVRAYRKRLGEKLSIKKEYAKGILKGRNKSE